MRKLIFLLTIILALSITAQSQEIRISEDFQNLPLIEFFDKIESDHSISFFYQKEWVDSLLVNQVFDNTAITVALSEIFKNTKLSCYLIEDRVIILNNVVIIDQPRIMDSQMQSGTDSPEAVIPQGLIFSREYLGKTDDSADLENYVTEIGNRNELAKSGISTIAGYIKDRETGDPITGALIYSETPFIGVTSDQDGFYAINLPNGKHRLFIQYVGMKTSHRNVVVFSNGKLDVNMEIDIIALNEVTIVSDRDQNIKNPQMGVSRINIEDVKTVPIVLGENDIMKVATTQAGVQTVGEGAAGFNVRGGKADQNLILINDAPVYNASHFFGFFSVFNSDAIESMELFKSGMPAKHGGRLASVFDIKSKKANTEEYHGSGGISPITARLTLEVPLIKETTGLLVGYRSTYSNWVLANVDNARFKDNRVSFFDLITRIDHKIDDRNDLTFSTYLSKDKFRLSSDTLFSFSNFSFVNFNGSLKWNHKVSNQINTTISAIHSRYSYELLYDESIPNAFSQDFGLAESTIKAGLEYFPTENQKIEFGVSTKHYNINPGRKEPLSGESIIAPEILNEEKGLESALYLSDQYEWEKLLISVGVRYVVFNSFGPNKLYYYENGLPKNNSTIVDSANFGKGEIIKTYHAPEWRFSGRYSLGKVSSLKMGISRTRQYIHTMSNSASLSPTDTWRLSSQHLKPQTSDEVSLGYYQNFARNTLELSIETYYKRIQNLVDFKSAATFLLNENIERAILQGPGKSYGIEFSLNKTGRLNGWINYAYARTFIKLDGNSQEEIVNGGKFFPTNYDKPHTFNLVANYKLTRRLSFSSNITYNTGRPVTIPVAAFDFKGSQNILFSDRNEFRIPDYFRIDFGVNLEGNHKIQKLSHSFWSLSFYNLTGRDNPFSVFFDVKDSEIRGSQLIVFGNVIPTLSYNFKF
jgi:hypothetical protein